MRSLAERAARLGGDVVRSSASRPVAELDEKGAGDYVTDVDRASERAIRALLREETPDISVLGEEAGGRALTSQRESWVVDPLDGTTNFVHGFPVVAVSVALVVDGRASVGAVDAPFLGETYCAARGHGATVRRSEGDSTPLRAAERPPERAIVATGFPFRRKHLLPNYIRVMSRALERFEDLRRPGAAALDLAWVAAGVFDGFFELGLSAWDVAAGALLVEEAGGLVTDWQGGADVLSGNVLAGSPRVHPALLTVGRYLQ
jgi:myo-inositol-1(or 4)-monophosphatase